MDTKTEFNQLSEEKKDTILIEFFYYRGLIRTYLEDIKKDPKLQEKALKRLYRMIGTSAYDITTGKDFCLYRVERKDGKREKGRCFMFEHGNGRNSSAEKIVSWIIANPRHTVEEFYAELKRLFFTIYIRMFGNDHTTINMKLAKLQNRGKDFPITFEEYNSVLDEMGYNSLPEELKKYFEI